MKRRLAMLFLLLGAILAMSPAFAQDPKVRVSLGTKDAAWVGQRIVVVVELLAPGYFASAPSFQIPDPPGMLIIPPTGSPLVGNETIDGLDYTVQRHEVSVFALRGGTQTMPALTIRFQFKRAPLDKDTVAATVKTEPVPLNTKVPPGAEKLGLVISTQKLTAVETWQPEPGEAKAGDAFTRTITFTAPDVPAMAFPPFPAGKIDGLGIYPKPPEVLDRNDRGDLIGERRDVVTYVCQKPGAFTIPRVQFTWWNVDTQKLETILLPARALQVAPNPAMPSAATTDAAPTRATSGSVKAAIGAGMVAVSLNLLVLFLAKKRAWWTRLFAPFRPVRLQPLNPTSKS